MGERVELDLPDGGLPSLSQRFKAKTGLDPSAALAPPSQEETPSERGDSATPPSKERA